jgi:hypothetical protein
VLKRIPDTGLTRRSFQLKAGDINESVIKMWKAAQKGWTPPTKCSKARFYELKGNGKSSAEKGFVGHQCAYRNVYFSTYDARPDQKPTAHFAEAVVDLATTTLKPSGTRSAPDERRYS